MTARCALYKWIEWAVAEIWPFEIIQDGGLPPTWIWWPWKLYPRKQTWSVSDHSLRRYNHSRILGAYGTRIWGEGEVVGVSDGTIRKSDGGFCIVTVALSVTIRPQFVIECLRRSNQQGVSHFGPKCPGVPLRVGPWCLCLQRANIRG